MFYCVFYCIFGLVLYARYDRLIRTKAYFLIFCLFMKTFYRLAQNIWFRIFHY